MSRRRESFRTRETVKDFTSYVDTRVVVKAPERAYEEDTRLQQGLSSIVGLYMVTSNCPIMDQLRPMVRFHLPFAASEETLYRAVSMYVTKQYYAMRRGETSDWELEKLAQIYSAISVVNTGMSQRLKQASTKDANVNALIILSTFGETVGVSIKDGVGKIEYLCS